MNNKTGTDTQPVPVFTAEHSPTYIFGLLDISRALCYNGHNKRKP